MSRPTNPPEVPCPVHGCALTGTHDRHLTAGGRTFTREVDHGIAVYTVTEPDDDPATLRARLQERYERPERPCTYDPADEDPEDWTPPRPEPLEYSGIPVVVDPEQEEGTVRVVSWTDQTRGFVDSLLDFPAVAPQGGPDPMATWYPSDMFTAPIPAIGRPSLPYRILHAELKSLRSYLRTLTNPDATANEVDAALALLTDADRALVTAKVPTTRPVEPLDRGRETYRPDIPGPGQVNTVSTWEPGPPVTIDNPDERPGATLHHVDLYLSVGVYQLEVHEDGRAYVAHLRPLASRPAGDGGAGGMPVTLDSIRAAVEEVGPVDPREADAWIRETTGFGPPVASIFTFPAIAEPENDYTRARDAGQNTVGGLSKKAYDPSFVDDLPVFTIGHGFETYGDLRKRTNTDTNKDE